MKIAIDRFRGEIPVLSDRLLPAGYASNALNCKLVSGDIDGFLDIGNPFQLAKAAPINTVWQMRNPSNFSQWFWLQWSQSELVSPATNIDVSNGTVTGDTTGRVYITGLDVPRFTDLFHATDPSEQGSHLLAAYPYITFPLGVPNPTTAPSVTAPSAPPGTVTSFTYDGSSFEGWQAVGAPNWSIDSGAGRPAPSWKFTYDTAPRVLLYSTNAFGLISCTAFTMKYDFDFQSGALDGTNAACFLGSVFTGSSQSGPYVALSTLPSTGNVFLIEDGNGNVVASTPVTAANNTFYHVEVSAVTASQGSTSGFNITAVLSLTDAPSSILGTISGFIPLGGDSFAFGSTGTGSNEIRIGFFDNVMITVTAASTNVTDESTNYVYTYVNSFSQESGPSEPSATITIYLNTSVNPHTISPVSGSVPAFTPGQDVDFYNLYRLVQGNDGSETYEFDQQLTASSSMSVPFTDTKLDSQLGEALITGDFLPPLTDMQGILALPNGIMAGFSGKTLCLSTQDYPYSWPIGNQYATDTPIVAIAAIDATVLALTQAEPYTAWGNDPGTFQMSKETASQGCVSKRSVATHKVAGAIYASGNGLCAFRGQGQLTLITEKLFSFEQWRALVPSSIIGVVHQDMYWFWYDTGTVKGGYILSLTGEGFGLVPLDFHVTAAFVDRATDTLYLVPDHSVYRINGNVVSTALNVLSQWDYGPTRRQHVWERDDYLLPRPANFARARVRFIDLGSGDTLALTISSEVGTAFNGVVSAQKMFAVSPRPGIRWNIGVTVTGDMTINEISLAETAPELTG